MAEDRLEDVLGKALLAKDAEGWANLRYLSSMAFAEGFYYDPRIDKELLRQHSKGLFGMTACLAGEIPRLIRHGEMDAARDAAREYNESQRDFVESGQVDEAARDAEPRSEAERKELIEMAGGIEEAQVDSWLKSIGDPVAAGEQIVVVSTPKVTLEIGERTEEVLAEYTRWVEKSAGISANEAPSPGTSPSTTA